MLQLEARLLGVGVEHFDRVEGVLVQVFAYQTEFAQNVMCHSDDVTSDGIGLQDVKQFPWTCPYEL